VETKVLNQVVKRNIDIFPKHFMFEMTEDEFTNWRSQSVTSNADKTGLRLVIEKLKRATENNRRNIELVFQYIDELTEKKENTKPRKKIGYKFPKKK
jgi:hypothetical protein